MDTIRYTYTGTDDIHTRSFVTMSNLKPDPDGDLIEFPHTRYSDVSGGLVERSNYEHLYSRFDQYLGRGIWTMVGGNCACGIIYDATMLDNDQFVAALDSISVSSSSILDDRRYNELAYLEELNAWDEWIRFELPRRLDARGIPRPYFTDDLRQKFYDLVHAGIGEFVHERAYSASIDLEEVLDHWTDEDDDEDYYYYSDEDLGNL